VSIRNKRADTEYYYDYGDYGTAAELPAADRVTAAQLCQPCTARGAAVAAGGKKAPRPDPKLFRNDLVLDLFIHTVQYRYRIFRWICVQICGFRPVLHYHVDASPAVERQNDAALVPTSILLIIFCRIQIT
jgi:hypothetical protein